MVLRTVPRDFGMTLRVYRCMERWFRPEIPSGSGCVREDRVGVERKMDANHVLPFSLCRVTTDA